MDNKQAIQGSAQDPILDFLALFNQIDKHFDKILGIEKFIPYNEKLKRIMQGSYSISWFIKMHKYQLRYFGEIRNQISHGIKLDGHTYVIPSEYALEQLSKYATTIKKPPKVMNVFNKKVFVCSQEDNLQYIVNQIDKNNYSHIPVYNGGYTFVGVITESIILAWLARNFNSEKKLEHTKVKELTLATKNNGYSFITKHESIYHIDKIFTEKKENHKAIGALFITDSGESNEEITGIITAGDTALIDQFIIH